MDVRLDELGRSFGPVEAVRGISLEIREGETFGLLGPNGAGKTTTLQMLSTLLEPSSGDAWIFGESLRRNVFRVKRIVGLTPQEISLYPELTAEENLLFFGRISGVHGHGLRSRVEELIVRAYLQTLLFFRKPEFAYGDAELCGQVTPVPTRILSDKDEYFVDYEMSRRRGRWLATDVVIEGISITKNYRNQFRAIVARQSFEELLA